MDHDWDRLVCRQIADLPRVRTKLTHHGVQKRPQQDRSAIRPRTPFHTLHATEYSLLEQGNTLTNVGCRGGSATGNVPAAAVASKF
jgi:hypothetical protein